MGPVIMQTINPSASGMVETVAGCPVLPTVATKVIQVLFRALRA
jgi:hypothetical protein